MLGKKNKGISPVLAVLLLVLITVAITIAVYYFLTSYFGSLGHTVTRETLRYGEEIHLDEYSISVSDNTVTLTMYLRAKVDIHIIHVYVKADDNVILSQDVDWTITSQVQAFTISFTYSGAIYEVTLISETGNRYSFIITLRR